jgi:hypothetical protein
MSNDQEVKKYSAGETMFRVGDPGGDLILIKKGKISLCKTDKMGDDVEIAQLNEGEIMGVMTFMNAAPRAATAIAITDVEVHITPTSKMASMLKQVPDWVMILFKDLVTRLNIGNDNLVAEIEKTKDLEQRQISRIKVVTQVIQGLNILGEMMTEDKAGKKFVPLIAVMKKLETIFGYQKKLMDEAIEALVMVGYISKPSELGNPTLSQVQDLMNFVEFTDSLKKNKVSKKKLDIEKRDRRQLWAFIEVSKKLELPQDKPATLYFAELKDTMEGFVKRKFEPMAVEAAKQAELVETEKIDGRQSFKFVPDELRLQLLSIDLHKKIVKPKPKIEKRAA